MGFEFSVSPCPLLQDLKENPGSEGVYGSFRKFGIPYFGVLIIRILLFRVLYSGTLFSETPISLLHRG